MASTRTTGATGPAADVVASAQQVLDHLGRVQPARWAATRTVAGCDDLLAVSGPDDAVTVVRRLVGSGGQHLGALWASEPPSAAVRPLLPLLADLLATILELDLARDATARHTQLLHAQALTDELTGLLNRRGWTQVLESEAVGPDADSAPSVIVIDLDRLKEVNDGQGHVAGDEYLQLAAVTVAAVCREDDLVARLGGDEFGVLVRGSRSDAGERLVRRIRQALDAAGVAASIGRAAYDPAGGLEATWWQADEAMYAEKQRRRSAVLA